MRRDGADQVHESSDQSVIVRTQIPVGQHPILVNFAARQLVNCATSRNAYVGAIFGRGDEFFESRENRPDLFAVCPMFDREPFRRHIVFP
jgi:hypothetical protein